MSRSSYSHLETPDLPTASAEWQSETQEFELNACLLHEMRNTLGAVSLALAKLADPATPDRELLATQALQAVTHLTGVINSGLDLSSLQAGKFQLSQINLLELLGSVINMADWGGARSKNIHVAYTVDADVPPTIISDVIRMRQVMINLLFNALKFTPEGGSVTMHMARVPDGHTIRFEVSDTGMGMSRETCMMLFQQFEQAAGVSRSQGGTGLGLFISRLIVEAMGGTIGVTSEEGVGSTFYFELPLRVPDAQPETVAIEAQPVRQDAVSKQAVGMRVLIVEDEEMIRKLTQAILSSKGYQCAVAATGQEALVLAAKDKFDFLLVDSSLGDLSGIEVVESFRRLETDSGTKAFIIGMSGYSTASEEFTTAGADAFLAKPFMPGQLLDSMARQ